MPDLTESYNSDFLADISRYFRDFLDTDFRRQRTPKRSITRQDKSGNTTAISLGKYPTLVVELWKRLGKPVATGGGFTVPRNRYLSKLTSTLLDAIEKHVKKISSAELEEVKGRVKVRSRAALSEHKDDPERLRDSVVDGLERELTKSIVVPLLNRIEGYLQANVPQILETIREVEDDLAGRLLADSSESIGTAMNTALVEGDFSELDTLIDDLLSLKVVRAKVVAYFESFATTDFFSDLFDLFSTLKVRENFQVYLYVGEIRYANNSFPLFYIPLGVKLEEGIFHLTWDPHLYLNKKAVEYVAQELAQNEGRPAKSLVSDRILYLDKEQDFRSAMQEHIDSWTAELGLKPQINLLSSVEQKAVSTLAAMTNRLSFAAFDRSDESLLNDYEALLTSAEGGDSVFEDFAKIIRGFLKSNPLTVRKPVDKEWSETSVQDRLVFRTPIPLNEEQRKIVSALRKDDCRFVAVQGPPGTGKSHTITALAFEAILNGRSVLVLSDKKEALDVVEDKLTQTLNKVRHEDDFQNPILRLGKANNTYGKILRADSMERIKSHHQAAEAKKKQLAATIEKEDHRLRSSVAQMAQKYSEIELTQILDFLRLEREAETNFPKTIAAVEDVGIVDGVLCVQELGDTLLANDAKLLNLLKAVWKKPTLENLAVFAQVQNVVTSLRLSRESIESLGLFASLKEGDAEKLVGFIRQYQEIQWPIVGFLFTRAKARAIDKELGDALDCKDALDVHGQLEFLIHAARGASKIAAELKEKKAPKEAVDIVFRQVVEGIRFPDLKTDETLDSIRGFQQFASAAPEILGELGLDSEALDSLIPDEGSSRAVALDNLFAYLEVFSELKGMFDEIPKFDYAGLKSRLESLHASELANTIDERVVNFFEEKRTTAKSIKEIVRKKRKFPLDRFEDLKKAFPCIIANIREFGEYVPLRPALFDLVIIDEASQVSIAQAFPAILRAKKLVVLGDQKQFSNVKTTNAKIAINNQYLNRIRENYRRAENPEVDEDERLKKFDIKTSVLDFVDNVANYGAMLKKHFRGYPELISFSSKFFYNGGLQAVKVRGKPIDDVLKFTVLEHDGKLEAEGNVNDIEAEFILEKLRNHLKSKEPPTVGIITPFTDQQRFLTRKISEVAEGNELFEKLHLKVMTFDSCQGEERHIIYYSMVAYPSRNRLFAIFPKSLTESGDVEDVLRLQRMNVGFSRAQEQIHFVLSQPVEAFTGSIGTALRHYWGELERGRQGPGREAVDPKSPMEAKVFDWLKQTQFYQLQAENIEIIPQFPIGEYLRQLDHEYVHPAYRVDFLLRMQSEKGVRSIIIEYDGFKEHFTNLDEIDETNYTHYYKESDVEREKILESYGYKILRINRFNLGKDPIDELSRRLERLSKEMLTDESPHELVNEVGEIAEEVANGQRKKCSKCRKLKELSDFRDSKLVRGVGRICQDCKNKKPRSRSDYRRSWRRRRW